MADNTKRHYAEALPLFGDLYFIVRNCVGSTQGHPRKTFEDRPELTLADKRRLMAQQKQQKRARQRLQKAAEILQDTGDDLNILEITKRNNSGLRHIFTFINLVQFATDNGLGCALGKLGKRFRSEEDAVKEWRLIRNRLKRIAPEICAVSIGRRPQGRWVIRWCAVGSSRGEDIFCKAAPVHLYLANKRGWSSSAVTMEAESGKLQGHYLTRLGADEETLAYFTGEMFESYRAALAMPKLSRTFRTEATSGLLRSRAIPVADGAAYVVSGYDERYSSPSGRALCKAEVKGGKIIRSEWVCAKEPVEFDEDDHGESGGDPGESEF